MFLLSGMKKVLEEITRVRLCLCCVFACFASLLEVTERGLLSEERGGGRRMVIERERERENPCLVGQDKSSSQATRIKKLAIRCLVRAA